MNLGQKIRYLRTVEGGLRGLGRPMTQLEVALAMKRELRKNLSQPYLSQIENGKRPHSEPDRDDQRDEDWWSVRAVGDPDRDYGRSAEAGAQLRTHEGAPRLGNRRRAAG